MSVDTRSWNSVSWYPTSMITYDEVPPIEWDKIKIKSHFNSLFGAHSDAKVTFKTPPLLLTKCMECSHCVKLGNGDWICKYSMHGGKPEEETCNYERKRQFI